MTTVITPEYYGSSGARDSRLSHEALNWNFNLGKESHVTGAVSLGYRQIFPIPSFPIKSLGIHRQNKKPKLEETTRARATRLCRSGSQPTPSKTRMYIKQEDRTTRVRYR